MTTFEFAEPQRPSSLLSSADVTRVADVLRGGGLAVLPTETGYLLASAAGSVPAVLRAFAVKQRDLANPMHVACSSIEMASQVGQLTATAVKLLGRFTPGPLSVIVEKAPGLDNPYVTLKDTIGLRIPDHAGTVQVIAALGSPVTATSLNRSGQESEPVDRALLESLDWQDQEVVPVIVDHASIRFRQPSTLVRVTGPEAEILRVGPVTAGEIGSALEGMAHRHTGIPVPSPS